MARWTPGGWTVCLGAAIPNAWWDGRCGLDFELETQARKVCADKSGKDGVSDDHQYSRKVMTLELIATMLGEKADQVRMKNLADPKALWLSLSMMERKRLVKQQKEIKSSSSSMFGDSLSVGTSCKSDESSLSTQARRWNGVASKIQKLALMHKSKFDGNTESVTTMPDGTIVIPAASCVEPKKSTKTVLFMLSFLGGQQVFLDKDGSLQYILSSPPAGKYNLTCRIVTVHDERSYTDSKIPPLLVTIDTTVAETNDEGGDEEDNDFIQVDDVTNKDICSVHSISLPYTRGLWQETSPIQVELPSNVTSCTINLSREATSRGLAIKDLRLTPI